MARALPCFFSVGRVSRVGCMRCEDLLDADYLDCAECSLHDRFAVIKNKYDLFRLVGDLADSVLIEFLLER
jgi:hypothetical protein